MLELINNYMSFDDAVNKVLQEQYFGGSPFEQITGIKRHVTFEENHHNPLAKQITDALNDVPPYYSRDEGDLARFGDPGKRYTENPKAQDEHDKIVTDLLGDAELMKVDIQEGGSDGDVHVYALRDERLVDSLKPLGLVAMSTTAHGMETNVGPLDQWYSIMIGQKMGDKLGSFTNIDGDLIRRNKPLLVNKGGARGRLYVGLSLIHI